MGHISFDLYSAAIATLKASGLVQERNFLLTWVEPKNDQEAK